MRPLSIALAFLSLATQLTTMSSPALARAPVTNVCGADTSQAIQVNVAGPARKHVARH